MTGCDFKLECLFARTPISQSTGRFLVELEYLYRVYTVYCERFRRKQETQVVTTETETLVSRLRWDHDIALTDVRRNNDIALSDMRRNNDIVMNENIILKQMLVRYVPWSATLSKEEQVVIVRMSPDYVLSDTDPAYLNDCTHVFMRTQKIRIFRRLDEIRSYGNGTNSSAVIVARIDTPNSRLLFTAFKSLAKDTKTIMINRTAAKGNENDMIDVLLKAEETKYTICHSIDDDDDDDYDELTRESRRAICTYDHLCTINI